MTTDVYSVINFVVFISASVTSNLATAMLSVHWGGSAIA